MTRICAEGNHKVGAQGGDLIALFDWDRRAAEHERLVIAFNKGMRQGAHPGTMLRFNYCPECGASLDTMKVRGLTG